MSPAQANSLAWGAGYRHAAGNPVTARGWAPPRAFDAILLASFGGPEGQEDVLPFLRNVTAGKGIPDERLEEVAHHYRAFGGVSPINEQNRRLRVALEGELAQRDLALPVLWGNRNWDPYLPQVLKDAYAAGHRSILALTTSAYSCYSSCRQYREDLAGALRETGLEGKLTIEKVRQYFDHPGFIAPFVEGAAAAVGRLAASAGRVHVLFSTHSIPLRDAQAAGGSEDEPRAFEQGSAYVAQHLAVARKIVEQCGSQLPWSLVYQSRSGPPSVPWLEPDINDALEQLAAEGVEGVVVVPLGFVSDHMEVIWDLDTEARETAQRLGLAFERVPTPGTHPVFVTGLAELIQERLVPEGQPNIGGERDDTGLPARQALTGLGPWYDLCRPGCCANPRGLKPAVAGSDCGGRA